jgi:hypothetical protein
MDETWEGLPELHGYEVSTAGRVRKWTTYRGRAQPKLYTGSSLSGLVYFKIRGESYHIAELMHQAFGDEADKMDASYDPRDRDRYRDLTAHEENEIRTVEGLKPAYEVAEDFRIDSEKVRRIWDRGGYDERG